MSNEQELMSEISEILHSTFRGGKGNTSKVFSEAQTQLIKLIQQRDRQHAREITADKLLNTIADGMRYDETFTFTELEEALDQLKQSLNTLKGEENGKSQKMQVDTREDKSENAKSDVEVYLYRVFERVLLVSTQYEWIINKDDMKFIIQTWGVNELKAYLDTLKESEGEDE